MAKLSSHATKIINYLQSRDCFSLKLLLARQKRNEKLANEDVDNLFAELPNGDDGDVFAAKYSVTEDHVRARETALEESLKRQIIESLYVMKTTELTLSELREEALPESWQDRYSRYHL